MGEIVNTLCTYDDALEILFTQEQIRREAAKLGERITEDYKGKELVVICVLNGAVSFFADLFPQIKLPLKIDFIQSASYGEGTVSNGNPIIKRDIILPIKDKHILLVEDIVDTGHSGQRLYNHLGKQGPSSMKMCTMLDKPSRREVNFGPDYIAFEIPNEFVVGYGLDYDGLGRNLPYIAKVKNPEKGNPFRRT